MDAITANLKKAIKVRFIKPIFEEDFVETGMIAWLVKVEYSGPNECFKLHFNFSDFEDENDKYFVDSYYENIHTKVLGIRKPLYTAKEAGMYFQRYSVFFCAHINGVSQGNDEAAFAEQIKEYLEVIE